MPIHPQPGRHDEYYGQARPYDRYSTPMNNLGLRLMKVIPDDYDLNIFPLFSRNKISETNNFYDNDLSFS